MKGKVSIQIGWILTSLLLHSLLIVPLCGFCTAIVDELISFNLIKLLISSLLFFGANVFCFSYSKDASIGILGGMIIVYIYMNFGYFVFSGFPFYGNIADLITKVYLLATVEFTVFLIIRKILLLKKKKS